MSQIFEPDFKMFLFIRFDGANKCVYDEDFCSKFAEIENRAHNLSIYAMQWKLRW